MGGNALKHLNPVRLTSAQVIDLMHHLHRNWQLISKRPLYMVPWLAEKPDHGDIDLICESDAATVERFVGMIGADCAAISYNDRVLSVPVPLPWDCGHIVQVDFICCSPEEAPAMRFFYAGGEFGMLLGRVASWQGLVFGMDGLRYRAERGVPWAVDIHLTSDPIEVLAVLGYPPVLPWFDTYITLWRFALSSPLAGPWVFMPESTNHENRSRDKQRPKVRDLQAWLRENFADRLESPTPRPTPAEAQEWVRTRFPAIGIDERLRLQEANYLHSKMRVRLLGIGAVEDVLGPGHSPELLGEIVHEMQALLPDKAERDAALDDAAGWARIITHAREAAASVATSRGLTLRQMPSLPEYVPAPRAL